MPPHIQASDVLSLCVLCLRAVFVLLGLTLPIPMTTAIRTGLLPAAGTTYCIGSSTPSFLYWPKHPSLFSIQFLV
nr:MAG TPA: hypothetical protein [Caudoviricetes sp.]